ncbi:glutathione transferase [Metapseudomonas lalkuanensis]|uniref:Glutathione transferase n=1 Tax=Metapseudomonas lalkuanensis TaxID=2604832 RepID=A0A5J6QMU9_9GAMM|nr:glutathione transferase [Pseudomonas lalkuanensis]QEY63002.1 glutathione transferase [Pseudomonas lalkuanensis]
MSSKVQLYVDHLFASPYSMSVFVALVEKGLDFDIINIDIDAGEQHSAEYAKLSITRRVPMIIDDGFALTESSAITEYLDYVYPDGPLYPRAPRAKARARQLQAWIRSDFMPIREERSTAVIFYRPTNNPLSENAQQAAHRLFEAIDPLIENPEANLFGEWSIVDVDLALLLNRMVMNGDDVPPKLAAYAKNQWKRPSVVRWTAQARPDID